MQVEDFKHRCAFLHRMTADFVAAVPDDKWEYTPLSAGPSVAMRHGEGFAPFNKQLRHVICVRGVYAEALTAQRADFSRKHSHYDGALTREALSAALEASQEKLLAQIDLADPTAHIDFFGNAFSFGDFAFTAVQHEAIHHGQWSLYAALAGFETPRSWRMEWGL
jgi:uncharacterized damage-inducible protein DinB